MRPFLKINVNPFGHMILDSVSHESHHYYVDEGLRKDPRYFCFN